MATLTVLRSTRAGEQMSPATAAAGLSDDFPNDGKTIFLVYNGGASPCDVSFAIGVDPQSGEPTQSTVAVAQTVAVGEDHVFGPFPTNVFGNSVAVSYDQVSSVTVLPISQG